MIMQYQKFFSIALSVNSSTIGITKQGLKPQVDIFSYIEAYYNTVVPQAVFIISYDNYSFIMQILHYVKYPKQFYQANHIVIFCGNVTVAAEYKVCFE